MIKIQKTICREELKSRIPALFAYIEENDAGEFKLHKATDSPQGCYGKIIENMIINASLTVDGQSVIISGNTYSYRTIMNTYYQYKNNEEVVNDNKSFFDFIDRAIGKIEINLDELGLNETDNDLVPHYIYLANARRLFNQYSKMKIVYDYYTGGDDTFDVNALEGDICCLCAKYRRMGGTVMYNKLKEFISKAENIANEYYDYISENKLTFNLNLVLNQSIHDIGYLSCYLNEWVGGDEHFEGELYTYNGRTYRCTETNHDIYNKETMRFEFDNTKFELIPQTKINPNGGTDYQLKGSSDSKLKSLRRFKQYINGQDKEEKPSDNEDWLYYYRKGIVINYTTVNTDLGNIADVDKLNEGILESATDVNKLAAYGNVISNIKSDQTKRTITFEYYLNVHLIAKYKNPEPEIDDDGNEIHKFDGFYLDENDKYHGIKYTETYNYEEGGELDKLINGEIAGITFEDYVSDAIETYVDFNKYAFSTIDSTVYYDKRLDTQIVSIPYVKSDYEVLIKNETDYLFADTFKTDYLNGITYKPILEKDVRIDRGNYAAFERHLKLAEVKTMEDIENYSNNSFFNIQKVN
jgi:hypothetical protein